MATIAPAPPGKKKTTAAAAPVKKNATNPHWTRLLTRSGYLVGAILFHLILFLLLLTWVVFRAPVPPTPDFQPTYVPPSGAPPPPPASPQQTMPVPTKALASPQNIITVNSPAPEAFNVPLPDFTVSPTLTQNAQAAPAPIKTSTDFSHRLSTIKSTETEHWGRSMGNIMGSNGDPHNVIATFPVYVASYLNGDWACNLKIVNGQIIAGSMPNLVAKINEWSHGNIKGAVVPTPLAIGSPELASKKPPFIFFTGHKDFVLTEQEVENLRSYLQDGGAIWGDNALAGSGSRFDIAFRREMKRVIPDIDKNFEDMPMTSDLFTKSWFPITQIPQGMNFYGEPIQHIDIDGKLAILYTPNDYSDLLFMHILPGDQAMQTTEPIPGQPLFTYFNFLWNASVLFRNFTLPAGLDAHRLGMNIVGHLLVRFDKELMMAP
jgi:hypothetical protein